MGLTGVEEPILLREVPCYWLGPQTSWRERKWAEYQCSSLTASWRRTECDNLCCLSFSGGPYLQSVSGDRPLPASAVFVRHFFSQQRERALVAHFTESSTGRKGCMHGGLGVVGCVWGGAGVLPPAYVVLWLTFSFVQAQGPGGSPYITQAPSGHCHSPPCSLVDLPLLRHTHTKGRKTYLPNSFILLRPLSRPLDCIPVKQYWECFSGGGLHCLL